MTTDSVGSRGFAPVGMDSPIPDGQQHLAPPHRGDAGVRSNIDHIIVLGEAVEGGPQVLDRLKRFAVHGPASTETR